MSPTTTTEVIYTRVPAPLKEAAEVMAGDRGVALSTMVTELLGRGLQAVSDEDSIVELENRNQELAAALVDAQAHVNALEQREQLVATAHRALAARTEQPVGACPGCGQPVTGHDLLVTGTCSNCHTTLASLIQPRAQANGGLNDTDFKVLIGAVGLLLGIVLLQTKST